MMHPIDMLRQLIAAAYPEIEIFADCDGHGFGRELHVRNGRGFQGILRDEADLFHWFGDRGQHQARAAAVRQRELF